MYKEHYYEGFKAPVSRRGVKSILKVKTEESENYGSSFDESFPHVCVKLLLISIVCPFS